ncbi:hypothetical protein VTO73DRAFT_5505 [Trametes versicolor]
MNQPALYTLPEEVLQRICRVLATRVYPFYPTAPHGLVTLALTCRCLSEIALDVLWSTLQSLSPLLCTLPEDLFAFLPVPANGDGEYQYERYKAAFLRDPVPQDFVRLATYSIRVTVIDANARNPAFWDIGRKFPTEVWDVLLRHAPKPLLPNLRSLYHTERPVQDEELVPGRGFFHPADLLFGPNLRVVQLAGLWIHPHRPTKAIQALSRATQLVESLRLEARIGRPSNYASLACPELRGFDRLVYFGGYSINVGPDALTALGSLPSLQEMLLHVEPADYTWDALQHGRHASFFPALTKLTLYNIAFEWCAAFLHTVSCAALQQLHIRVHDPYCVTPDGAVFEALCAAIGSLPSGASLHDLDIRSPRTAEVVQMPAYHARHIAPLVRLKGALRRLYVRGPCQIDVDDATLEAMARAWPDIQEIMLPWVDHPDHIDDTTHDEGLENSEPPPYMPRATLAGLDALVRRCPQLAHLALAFDMRFVPELGEQAYPVRALEQVSALKQLSAEGSVLEDPIGVAAFLALMCPRLKKAGGDDWQDVMWYYLAFCRIREEEKKWAAARGRGLQGAASA